MDEASQLLSRTYHSELRELFDVFFQLPGIFVQVLVGTKLSWIHKDGCYHHIVLSPSSADQ